jgi:DNA-binding MarR family transcriptional regulator
MTLVNDSDGGGAAEAVDVPADAPVTIRSHPDLQLTGYAVLLWLAAHDRSRSADVATALDMDKGSVSRQIDQLERLGLVERVIDPQDKRAQRLVLTAAGSQGIAALHEKGRVELERTLATWTQGEIEDFARLLRRYNQLRD